MYFFFFIFEALRTETCIFDFVDDIFYKIILCVPVVKWSQSCIENMMQT